MGFSLCSKGGEHFIPDLALWPVPSPGVPGQDGQMGGRMDGWMSE